MRIVYPVGQLPLSKSESWIRLEIEYLKKRGIKVEPVFFKNVKKADFIYCHFATIAKNISNLEIPFAVVPHAVDIWPDNGKTLLEVSSSKNCKFVVAVTDYHFEKYREWGIKKPIYRINYAVDINTFTRTKDIRRVRKIVCGGRFVEKKGLEYAIRAVPDIVVFGDEPKRAFGKISKEYLESLSNKAKFLGWLSHRQLAKLFDSSWLLVSPNIETEAGDADGLPVTILEALAMGLQVITTEVAGIRTIRKFVHFVPQRSVEAIRKKVQEIKKELNLEGMRYVRENHNPEVIVDKILKCLV